MPGGAAAGAFAGIAIANNLARLTKGCAAAKTAWKAVEGLTLSSEVVDGAERPVLSGPVGAVPVTVRVVTDFVHSAATEVRATPVKGASVVLGLYPSPGGMLSSVRDWLRQDIKIGDEGFDAAFLITGKPAAAAPTLLLGGKIREHLARLLGPLAGFEYTKEGAQVMLSGVELDAEVLKTAIALVVEAAAWTE